MSAALLQRKRIDEAPEGYLRQIGVVFATFGADTQDSGNVSYGVQIGADRYFVKTAGLPDDSAPLLSHPRRVALLENAVDVAREVSHPALPALRGVVSSPHGPMLVYDWVDGELLYEPRERRSDPASPLRRFLRLPAEAICRCLDTVFEAHDALAAAGRVAVDFYDGCLLYDFVRDKIHLVDLDNYRKGPSHNDMGRMFGSSRFMAPEEFELGAPIDQRTNVFTLGRAVASFLSDGTLAPGAFRGQAALLEVAARACRPEREGRFETVASFCRAWRKARAR